MMAWTLLLAGTMLVLTAGVVGTGFVVGLWQERHHIKAIRRANKQTGSERDVWTDQRIKYIYRELNNPNPSQIFKRPQSLEQLTQQNNDIALLQQHLLNSNRLQNQPLGHLSGLGQAELNPLLGQRGLGSSGFGNIFSKGGV